MHTVQKQCDNSTNALYCYLQKIANMIITIMWSYLQKIAIMIIAPMYYYLLKIPMCYLLKIVQCIVLSTEDSKCDESTNELLPTEDSSENSNVLLSTSGSNVIIAMCCYLLKIAM